MTRVFVLSLGQVIGWAAFATAVVLLMIASLGSPPTTARPAIVRPMVRPEPRETRPTIERPPAHHGGALAYGVAAWLVDDVGKSGH